MGRYIRVLTPAETIVPVSALKEALAARGFGADLAVEAGRDEGWAALALSHHNGPEIAAIARTVVSSESEGQREIDRLVRQIADCKPLSSRRWLTEYLGRVRVIYGLQVLLGTEYANGWDLLATVRDRLWAVGGILQVDGEGFSNEEGYHVLWQFPPGATGARWMGVLRDGRWVHFRMDLGDKAHREAFARGEVPDGAELADA